MNSELLDLHDVQANDVTLAGGKGASLAKLLQNGFPIPAGFVITSSAFAAAMREVGIDSRSVGTLLARHPASYTNIRATSARLRNRVLQHPISNALRQLLADAIRVTGSSSFAVRSSALDEDSSGHSFAGMNESFTNLSSADEIASAVVRCWASAFGQRSLTYRALQKIDTPIGIAVVVQTMIDAHRSGVLFTRNPASANPNELVIEAALGQGEVVVGGNVEPDTFTVRRSIDGTNPDHISSTHIGNKRLMVTRDEFGQRVETALHGEPCTSPCLSEGEVLEIAQYGIAIEDLFGSPQDIEWCIDPAGLIWIVQARPITTGRKSANESNGVSAQSDHIEAVRGLAAAPGLVTGRARLARSLEDARALQSGEILVADMTSPDWISVLSRAGGVVTDRGGVTSHAAIVSRELGVPAVVGTRNASKLFNTGDVLRVDGGRGIVERVSSLDTHLQGVISSTHPTAHAHIGDLRTKVMVNLSHPRHAIAAARTPGVEGVGLLRAEMLLSEALGGIHPSAMIEAGRAREFVDVLAEAVTEISQPFGDRPVVYRTADFRSNEFRLLEGGERFEPTEENPMIGYRGCFRYVHDPTLFKLELEAIDRVRRVSPGLTLMLPFVRTKWELERCLEIVVDTIDSQAARLPIWIMAEVPSVLYRLDDYAELGISGVSIGSNDLTQLMLGVDRDSEVCAELFDEQDEAVLAAIADIIYRARRAHLSTSLCGQAPSNDPAFAGELVRMGIDSVSVDLSAVESVIENLLLAEANPKTQENP